MNPVPGINPTFALYSKTMHYKPEEINYLMRHRRSVFPRQFEAGKKVDDAIIKEILTNATWAPTHGRTEPWHFVVFTGGGLQKLADFQSKLYKETAGDKFKQDKYRNLQENPLKASHVIAIGMKRHAERRIPEVEEIAAVACAVQNIYLSVSAYGLGGYWTTGGITYNEKARPFFGLGEEDRLMGFFYIGHVAVPSPAGQRQPLEEKAIWVEG
jgi:nitroreductase